MAIETPSIIPFPETGELLLPCTSSRATLHLAPYLEHHSDGTIVSLQPAGGSEAQLKAPLQLTHTKAGAEAAARFRTYVGVVYQT